MKTFQPKPWNDPWTRRAMNDPGYKVYCTHCTHAARMSWRQIKKAMTGRTRLTKNGRRLAKAGE